MFWHVIFLLGGLVLLFFGGEGLVRGSVALADRFGISKIVVGMIIVGFGTSAPELLVSVQAALAGSPDISIGNVVGSNIANVLLIIGVVALIAPIANGEPSIRRDAVIMLVVSFGLVPFLISGMIGFGTGLLFLAILAAYLGATYWLEHNRRKSVFIEEAEELKDITLSPLLSTIAVVGGLAEVVPVSETGA